MMLNRKSKKIEVPLNKRVTLRVQSEYPIDDCDVAQINDSYNIALKYVSFAMLNVKSLIDVSSRLLSCHYNVPGDLVREYQNLFDQLKRHFNINTDLPLSVFLDYLKRIDESLKLIWNGMYAEHSTLCIGNVTNKVMDKFKREQGITPGGYSRAGYEEQNKNKIFLNLDMLLGDSHSLTEVFIHECTHKFANTHDYNINYDSRFNIQAIDALFDIHDSWSGTSKKLTELSIETRIKHAASMTVFICELATFSQEFQETKALSKTHPERELTLKDTHRFFAAKKPGSATSCYTVAVASAAAVATTAVIAGLLL
jgi:hypothetical protein